MGSFVSTQGHAQLSHTSFLQISLPLGSTSINPWISPSDWQEHVALPLGEVPLPNLHQ